MPSRGQNDPSLHKNGIRFPSGHSYPGGHISNSSAIFNFEILGSGQYFPASQGGQSSILSAFVSAPDILPAGQNIGGAPCPAQ